MCSVCGQCMWIALVDSVRGQCVCAVCMQCVYAVCVQCVCEVCSMYEVTPHISSFQDETACKAMCHSESIA